MEKERNQYINEFDVCYSSSKLESNGIEWNRIEQLWLNVTMHGKTDVELMIFDMYIEFHVCDTTQFGNKCTHTYDCA